MMGLLDGVGTSNFFPSSASRNAGREGIAQRSLLAGLDAYRKKNYDEALTKLKQAVDVAPESAVAVNAYDYMARVYQSKGDTESAIDAYKKAVEIDRSNIDIRLALGNVYILAGRPEEAKAEYAQAVKLDPSASNRYYLGQAYLRTGEYDKAELEFLEIRRQAPEGPHGDFGLGQAYAKQGRYNEAIQSFEAAIGRKRDYWDAYTEMGIAYTDMGDLEKANEIVNTLNDQYKQEVQALTLSAYIAKKTPPRLEARQSTGTFLASLGPGTKLPVLGSGLTNANAQQLTSIVFSFSEAMDPESVENVLNWSISRSIGTNLATTYNFGWAPPSTEVLLPGTPVAVQYDKIKRTATVYFNITQNATADGTIDPSHIQFSFKGVSADGMAMDPLANDYTGFSGFI